MTTTPKHGKKHPKPTPPREAEPIPDNDSLANDDRGTKPYRMRDQGRTGSPDASVEDRGQVAIDDPLPADPRQIQPSGETGEDEDLPDDDGNIER